MMEKPMFPLIVGVVIFFLLVMYCGWLGDDLEG